MHIHRWTCNLEVIILYLGKICVLNENLCYHFKVKGVVQIRRRIFYLFVTIEIHAELLRETMTAFVHKSIKYEPTNMSFMTAG